MSAPPPPPPYGPLRPESETTVSAESSFNPLRLSTGDILGVREMIRGNCPELFALAHGASRAIPNDFRICTVRAPLDTDRVIAGKIHAAVLSQVKEGKSAVRLSLFVQGPQADTTEEALRALLAKTEDLIGRRWGGKISVQKELYVE